MPKTLAEIAIEAGLLTKATAARAGKLAEQRGEPLIAVIIRQLGIDEVALLGAIRKQTRIPLLDPADIPLDPDALRVVPREASARLRVFPLTVSDDGTELQIAMADPTDTAAAAELEQLTGCELDIRALSLSAIDELIDRGYGLTARPSSRPGGALFVTSREHLASLEVEPETSITAQMPPPAPSASVPRVDADARLDALIRVLTRKGLVTEAELAAALSET